MTDRNPATGLTPLEQVVLGVRPWHVQDGHAPVVLASMPPECVHTVVTSPPYLGLRKYDTPPQVWGGDPSCTHQWGAPERSFLANNLAGSNGVQLNKRSRGLSKETGPFCTKCDAWLGELGSEPSPELYVEHLVAIFRELHRVLRRDGTVWLNIADSYARKGGKGGGGNRQLMHMEGKQFTMGRLPRGSKLKSKDLCLIPARLAIALQEDGWYVRQVIIWHKLNCLPESVTDRCTTNHEYILLLSKAPRYYFDVEAIKEPSSENTHSRGPQYRDLPKTVEDGQQIRNNKSFAKAIFGQVKWRNKRSVWSIATQPYRKAHFATFPPKLPLPCILAGTSARGCCGRCGRPWVRVLKKTGRRVQHQHGPGKAQKILVSQEQHGATSSLTTGFTQEWVTVGWRQGCKCENVSVIPCLVLDPFNGAGTTGVVARRLHRRYLGIEVGSQYVAQSEQRIVEDAPMFNGGIGDVGDFYGQDDEPPIEEAKGA
jgi:DNA modification methylase